MVTPTIGTAAIQSAAGPATPAAATRAAVVAVIEKAGAEPAMAIASASRKPSAPFFSERSNEILRSPRTRMAICQYPVSMLSWLIGKGRISAAHGIEGEAQQ